MNKKEKKIHSKFTTKMTVRLFIMMAVCAVLCCSCFRMLMLNQTSFYLWLVKKGVMGLDTETIIEEVKERAKNIQFEGASHKSLMKALELEKYDDGYTAIYVYQGEKGMFQFGMEPSVWDGYQVKPFWYSDLGYYKGQDATVDIAFKDTTAIITIYSYHQAQIVLPYLVISLIISLLFFLPIVIYMRNKMKYVGKLKDEILVMADGDLEHPVTVKGRDEIGILASELNQMRKALYENIRKEEETRRSNHELIRSISHDLRTPMTTMYGYLEILERKKCTEEERKEYISRCVQKMEEIRSLSDKMFEYAFVYDTKEQEEQTEVYVEEVLEELEKSGKFLELKGYEVSYNMEGCGKLLGSRMCLGRIWNNLFSNVIKYGISPVQIQTGVEKGNIRIQIMNRINPDIQQVESNKIGLKSVEKMAELQRGKFFITKNTENFAVTLEFPMISDEVVSASSSSF